jgi:hypothetical protein
MSEPIADTVSNYLMLAGIALKNDNLAQESEAAEIARSVQALEVRLVCEKKRLEVKRIQVEAGKQAYRDLIRKHPEAEDV